jgi:hypothetical protein
MRIAISKYGIRAVHRLVTKLRDAGMSETRADWAGNSRNHGDTGSKPCFCTTTVYGVLPLVLSFWAWRARVCGWGFVLSWKFCIAVSCSEMRIIKLEMRFGILRTVTQFDTSFLRGKSGSSGRAVSSAGSRNRVVFLYSWSYTIFTWCNGVTRDRANHDRATNWHKLVHSDADGKYVSIGTAECMDEM